jgi:hypothetical protein
MDDDHRRDGHLYRAPGSAAEASCPHDAHTSMPYEPMWPSRAAARNVCASATPGCTCAHAARAGTWVAATTRRTVMPASISTPPRTPSSLPSNPAKPGVGAFGRDARADSAMDHDQRTAVTHHCTFRDSRTYRKKRIYLGQKLDEEDATPEMQIYINSTAKYRSPKPFNQSS